jgi:hypothetical protein
MKAICPEWPIVLNSYKCLVPRVTAEDKFDFYYLFVLAVKVLLRQLFLVHIYNSYANDAGIMLGDLMFRSCLNVHFLQ